MKAVIPCLVVAIISAGCVTKQGISLPTGTGPTKENIEDFAKRNSAPPAQSPVRDLSRETLKTGLVPDSKGPKVIIIGNVMALTTFDEPTLNSRYDIYLKNLEARGASPTFTREWYLGTSAGETAVKFAGITGIYHRYFKAEIPKDLVRQITFASGFGSFMAGTSGDLVSAERTSESGTWITRLLCSEKSPDYSPCEKQYSTGVYQGIDGREIDNSMQVVEGGKVINPLTFMIGSRSGPQVPVTPSAAPAAPLPLSVPTPVTALTPADATAPTPGPVSPPVGTKQKDVAAQLEKLNELRAKGLITEAEYQKKRTEILDSL